MSGHDDEDSTAAAALQPSLASIAATLGEVQRQLCDIAQQMSSISSRVAAVEACPSSSTPAIPQDIPYGLSGYDGIPKVPVNIDPLPITTQPTSTTPFQSIIYPFLIPHHHYHHSPPPTGIFRSTILTTSDKCSSLSSIGVFIV
jgi:hypothetical protein